MESVNMEVDLQDDAVEIPIKEELVEEVMQELYRELHSQPLSAANNAPSSVVLPESCGASVSDSASTVMAGVDLVGPTGNINDIGSYSSSSWWWAHGGQVGVGCRCAWPVVLLGDCDQHEKGMDGSDGVDDDEDDDDWLARVMSWGPLELDPGFSI